MIKAYLRLCLSTDSVDDDLNVLDGNRKMDAYMF